VFEIWSQGKITHNVTVSAKRFPIIKLHTVLEEDKLLSKLAG